jgi:hypothetical protein
MKLKTLLIILVVFFILRPFSSPYAKAKKTAVVTLWPKNLKLNLLLIVDPAHEPAKVALNYYVDSLKSTSFTQSGYTYEQWNNLNSLVLNCQNKIAAFAASYTSYIGNVGNCAYFNPCLEMINAVNSLLQILIGFGHSSLLYRDVPQYTILSDQTAGSFYDNTVRAITRLNC